MHIGLLWECFPAQLQIWAPARFNLSPIRAQVPYPEPKAMDAATGFNARATGNRTLPGTRHEQWLWVLPCPCEGTRACAMRHGRAAQACLMRVGARHSPVMAAPLPGTCPNLTDDVVQ